MDNKSLDEIKQLKALAKCFEKRTSGVFVSETEQDALNEDKAELIQTKTLGCNKSELETDKELLELDTAMEVLETEILQMVTSGEYKGCLDKSEIKDPEVKKQLAILDELFGKEN